MSKRLYAFMLGALFLFTGCADASEITQVRLAFDRRDRSYSLYAPETGSTSARPLLVLLHGSGGNGLFIARLWKPLADQEGIILAAPDALRAEAWHLDKDGPEFVHAVVDDVARQQKVDSRRIYLFGQSGGAVYALTLAMLESDYFAAMAIHAGSWRQRGEFKVMDYARRRIPLEIIIGDRDEYFSMNSVRKTQTVLAGAGFPIEVSVLEGRYHAYTDETASETNAIAWVFLKTKTIEGVPSFTVYRTN